jgi:EAL domain-containing protein (putative c-di-GMP-specific phosphodiesterase class I)
VLARLRAVGAQLSVDDFGTGFSSMSFLREIAVNEVKVDGGFVRAAPTSQEDKAIVFATIALAHGLGLPIVGEGVETVEQLELLMEAGADTGQGFLLARPLPAGEFPSVAMRRNQTVVQALQSRPVVELEGSHADV